jgi:hypothetical protein
MVGAISYLVGLIGVNFAFKELSRPRTDYMYASWLFHDKAVEKQRIYNTEFENYEDRRRNAAGSAHGCPFASINIISLLGIYQIGIPAT